MPVKFDDIPKTANEVLNDDFQTSGYVLKAKQKTNFDAAVVTTQVDLVPLKPKTDGVATPAKITWKLPKPFSFDHVCIDKLEMDKAGKFKLECSTSKIRPDLKIEAKSDLVDPAKITSHLTFTGIKDTQIKLDTKPMKPQDLTLEATRSMGNATLGCKYVFGGFPDLGVRVLSGPMFGSLLVKDKFTAFSAHSFYKASDVLKLAATFDYGGKKSGDFSVGCAYNVSKNCTFKGKVQQDQSVSTTVKYEVSKGFTLLAGGKYGMKTSALSYGLQLSIE